MSTSAFFLVNLVLVVLFGALMVGESLRSMAPSKPVSLYWTHHKPAWRSLLEPDYILALSAAAICLAILWRS